MCNKIKLMLMTMLLALGLLSTAVYAKETTNTYRMPAESFSEAPEARIENPQNVSAPGINTEYQKRWINRINADSTMSGFYNTLEKGITLDSGDYLIDPGNSKGSAITEGEMYYIDDYGYEVVGRGIYIEFCDIAVYGETVDELLDKLDNAADEAYAEILAVYECFLMDHPEVFWLDLSYFINAPCVEITVFEDGSYKASATPSFVLQLFDSEEQLIFDVRHEKYRNPEEVRSIIADMNNKVASIAEPVKHKDTPAQLAHINEYLIANNDVNAVDDLDDLMELYTVHPEVFNCLGALYGTTGDCDPMHTSYAKAFHMLCNYLNIPCVTEIGTVKVGDVDANNYWNKVQVYSKWYVVDTALNDLSGVKDTVFLTGNNAELTYLGTTLEFAQSHHAVNSLFSDTEYKNSPVLAKESYVSSIESIHLIATDENYMYGYMDAPVISAEVTVAEGTAGTPEYAWYLIEPNKEISRDVSSSSSVYQFPQVYAPGEYQVCVEVSLNGSRKREMISIKLTNFLDVEEDDWFKEAVEWSIENEITTGLDTSSFGPRIDCTRAQIVTFIWRAAGCPEPGITVNPFADVKPTSYYYEPVLWAVERGITSGYTATQFAPNASCTRSEMVTFLWRNAGKVEPQNKIHAFTDVYGSKFYYDAMLWAVEEGIAKGYTANTFAPNVTVKRCETVTFLYRADGNGEKPVVNEGISGILTNRTNLTEDGILSSISIDRISNGQMQSITNYLDHLLVWHTEYVESTNSSNLKIAILNMETGAPIQDVILKGYGHPNLTIHDDVIVITDWGTGRVQFLDAGLKVLKQSQMSNVSCALYVSPDLSKAYSFTNNDGIVITDLETGSETVLLEHAVDLYTGLCTGNIITVVYTDRNTQMSHDAVVDLETGTVIPNPFDGSFESIQYTEDTWLARVMGGDNTYYTGRSDRPYAFQPQSRYTTVTLLGDPGRILFEVRLDNRTTLLELFDLDGTFISKAIVTMPNSFINGTPIWMEKDGGYYLNITNQEGKDVLVFWDLKVPVSGESLNFESAYKEPETGKEVAPELYARADELSEKYDVKIKIAELVIEENYDYQNTKEMDETIISEGLDIVDEVLASFPKGFMSQLKYGSSRSIEIHLTGDLITKNLPEDTSNSYIKFVGYAEVLPDKNVVIVNIARAKESVKSTLYHEIVHLIDFRLEFDAGIREDALYSIEAWHALNPEGFEYANRRVNLPPSIYDAAYDEWFIDLYSRTDIREDRARILEHALTGKDYSFTSAPRRMEKLKYFSACIRDCFDTTGWPEVTLWEEVFK